MKHELTPAITHIVNLSIQQKAFPLQWKRAKIIIKDEVIYPKNYRLLPIFSKILERAIFSQIIQYFEENDLIHPSHHGFRQKHSTSTALLQMFDVWVEAFENGDISAVIMLDMSAAFDLVDHNILVQKLSIYGFEDNTLQWFSSYLSQRTQQVYVDIGVPQGSILDHHLYIIYKMIFLNQSTTT